MFLSIIPGFEELGTLVQALDSEQRAHPLVEWKFVNDHFVESSVRVETSIADTIRNAKANIESLRVKLCGEFEVFFVELFYLRT